MAHAPPSLKLISAALARQIMLEAAPIGIEVVPLHQANGRVLAAAFAAPEDLPVHARSVMDGYAVRSADVAAATEHAPAILRVAGVVPMGATFGGTVGAGEAVGISTGGFLPDGADAIVMIEHTRASGDDAGAVEIQRAVATGGNVIQRGEDVMTGAVLIPAGQRLRPQDIAALATFGAASIAVHRRPRIAVLSTGNELCAVDETPGPGQVRDVNEWVLGAQITLAGGVATYGGVVRDDEAALAATIAGLLPDHDAVILAGGSSVGVKDVSGTVMGRLDAPGVLFHGIDIRPGKPTIFARVGVKPVIGMPGFPTSSMVVFDAFVRPLLWRMGGEIGRDSWPCAMRARLTHAVTSVAGREDYVRVRLAERDGETWAEPLPGGSSAISNLVYADGMVRVDAAAEGVPAGQWVGVSTFNDVRSGS